MDNKYMIEMAETRGLFGNPSSTSNRIKGSRSSKSKKQEKRSASPPFSKTKRKNKIDINRFTAPTQSSIRRSSNTLIGGSCPKDYANEANILIKVPNSRLWWSETARHLTNLRESLVNKKKLSTSKKNNADSVKQGKIDEIVAKSSENFNIPIFPKLKLTRSTRKPEKIPLPVSITLVQFPRKYIE